MTFIEKIKAIFAADKTIKEQQEKLNNIQAQILAETEKGEKLKNELKTIESNIIDAKAKEEDAIKNRDSEIQKTEENCKEVIEKYRNQTVEAQKNYATAKDELDGFMKSVEEARQKDAALKESIKIGRSLFKKIMHCSEDGTFEKWEDLENQIIKLEPTVELAIHSLDVKSLRTVINDTNKLIDATLERYSTHYTQKTNQAIYQLMVLALRAELQNILSSMKYTTYDKCNDSLKEMLNKYSAIAINGSAVILKNVNNFIAEIDVLFSKLLDTEYEYYKKKEQEKAEQQALKEQMKQEAEERKALEAIKKQVEKEESKYKTEIVNIEEQIRTCEDDEKIKQLELKIAELNQQLNKVEEQREEIAKRQNGKAGYVYIISNLGAFGENTFKVGMTRRLEPMDRIRELGDASVPFSFDVHSFIFSDDAVGLETELHNRLHSKRKNKINLRKEFFDISIDELEKLVEEINPAAEFTKTMIATEYRQGLEM